MVVGGHEVGDHGVLAGFASESVENLSDLVLVEEVDRLFVQNLKAVE